jgi:hypothetical protein
LAFFLHDGRHGGRYLQEVFPYRTGVARARARARTCRKEEERCEMQRAGGEARAAKELKRDEKEERNQEGKK